MLIFLLDIVVTVGIILSFMLVYGNLSADSSLGKLNDNHPLLMSFFVYLILGIVVVIFWTPKVLSHMSLSVYYLV